MYPTTKSTDKLKEQIYKIYGNKIDCSNIDYKNDRTKIKFVCNDHGDFYQYPGHLLQGHGCQKCSKMDRITEEEFIKQSNIVHNNKYIYPLGEYKNKRTKMKIICPQHGEFYQLPKHHIRGVGCKECNESKGEKKIKQLLKNMNLKFKIEKRFDKCKDKKPLPFDFYLEDFNLCIEYDGIQHFIVNDRFGGEIGFYETKRRDEIKTNFCIENDIKLIRISYKDNIEEKLKCCLTIT